tara:strand:+ start:707 stop:934 length:228 start_codon:yes stop_codon:yes gene_type:complete
MFELSSTLIKSIGIYLLVCYGLYHIKHPKMFNEKGEFRTFGLNPGETITPFWLVTTLVGLTTYYLLLIQDGKYVH